MNVRNVFCLIAILIVGCTNGVNERSLIGRYHFNTNHQDVLDILGNHTYIQQYTNSKGKIFQIRGTWRYNGKEINCYDFNFFNDLGPAGGGGIWISVVEKDNGKIKFIYSDDDDSGFVKD